MAVCCCCCFWCLLSLRAQDPEDVRELLAQPISRKNDRAAIGYLIASAKRQMKALAGSEADDARLFVDLQAQWAEAARDMAACGAADRAAQAEQQVDVDAGVAAATDLGSGDGDVGDGDVAECRRLVSERQVHITRMRNAVFVRDGERRVLAALVKRLAKARSKSSKRQSSSR